ncbi:3'-phosphoesterase [Candidatus Bathyarchaeota archaeon]|nr:3'-phosphoesterase [Candidatus Bathyarchaeota archaeon]
MGLEEYRRKRDFEKTPEPKGEVKSSDEKIYVIQKHQARRLHYDLRLEMDGVLKSWAVPKTPPLEKGVKRLAVQVEDHPIDYANFEGVIPEGHYGAGTVEIWDRGTYTLKKRDENKIVFEIHGQKLKGEYCLLKFKDDKNWLFFKTK